MKNTVATQTKSPKNRVIRRGPSPLALEQRFMFDGAAVADAVETVASKPQVDAAVPGAGLLHFAAPIGVVPAAVGDAEAAAEKLVADFLQQPNAAQDLFALLGGGQAQVSASWQQAFDNLQAAVRDGNFSLDVQLRSNSELNGALGAFAAQGTTGAPVIYLNQQYASSAPSEAIKAVLIEEIGHAIDHVLNGNVDSPGDEGHAFAALLLTGDAGLSAVVAENDHQVLNIDGQSVAVETAGPYGIAQVHFVPLPEPDIKTALTAISTSVAGSIQTTIAISATTDGTIIIYDQWEDGYEADIANPLQSSTLIWGDGNLANGTAPGTTDDLIHSGQTILLQNAVDPASPAAVDFDGRDKIGSTQAISVTKAGWSTTPGTVLAGAVAVIDAGNAGTVYTLPIGQNVETVATGTNKLFEYTSAHIIATADNTVVTVDRDGNAATTGDQVSFTLNQGQTKLVDSTLLAGGLLSGSKITATKGIGVYLIAGDVGSAYENRWFSLTPDEQWSSSYYAPVGTTLAADPAYVILYNPNATAIDVYYETATTTGKITVPANVSGTTSGGTSYFLMPASAAHFFTKDNSRFYAVSCIDADATSNATHDWSYSLVPETYLTTKFVVGWGPGNGNASPSTALNGSPIWVTAADDTTLYIDNVTNLTIKDSTGAAITGSRVGSSNTYSYDIAALQSYRIFDNSDNNQSGLVVYTTDGTLITAAWGEDPSIAGAGTPYLDMGTTVLPFPDYVFSKVSGEASPILYTGASNGNTQVELGEQIEYTISVTNRAVIDLFNINIKDAMAVPVGATASELGTYVAGSTTLKIVRADGTILLDTVIADKAIGPGATSIFPLERADGGYTVTDTNPGTLAIDGLKRGDQVIIKYRVQVPNGVTPSLALAGFVVTNDAEMTGSPAGSSTPIPSKIIGNQTVISINGTADGQVFLKDSGFAGVAATYQENATLGLEVNDADANLNSLALDTLTVTVSNTLTGETEQVTLTETGANTHIFRNTLATSTASSANNSGTLQMRTGDTIKVDYVDPVYGLAFDNPTNPGVAGDADNNLATGNANTAYASVPVPSQTKILYLSDDTTNNLDRILPPNGDTTAATTGLLVTSSSGAAISITDNFGTTTASYTAGSGWTTGVGSGWHEVSDDNSIGAGNVRVTATGSDNALIFRANSVGAYRNFATLASDATLTFDIKDGSSTRPYEDADYVSVQEFINGAWAEVGKIYGSSIGAAYATQTLTIHSGASGMQFLASANQAGDTSDRVYLDNIKIATGGTSTANASGATDFAIGVTSPAGQSFTFSNSGATTDAIAVDQITLSLKKTGTTAATATVSVRNAWDGSVLWSGTVSTSQLGATYQDIALAPSGLTLDKSGSYVIRVDSNASGIVWQGNTASSYADGTRISSTGSAVSASDLRFAINGHEVGLTSVTFSQSQTMATDFTIPAGGVVKVITYVTGETDLSGDSITAVLSSNGTVFATSSAPLYSNVDHTLTWIFSALGSAKTIAAGQAISLKITNSSANPADHFKIAYDSDTTRSRIELPTNTVITVVDADPVTAGVQEVAFFDNSLTNGGAPITSGFMDAGGIVYIRVKVADPFGDYDISSLNLNIDGPGATGDISLSMADAYVVNAASDGRAYKTYEYAWQTVYNVGAYNISVTAHEGSEGTVVDTASNSLMVTETDLGTPSTTMFLTSLGGVDAGAVYASGATAYLRVTDLDNAGRGSATATVTVGGTSYTVTLTEIGSSGIFEADLSNAATHGGNGTAAAVFASMPNGTALSASYTDWNDSSDISGDTIVVNTAPTATNNNFSIGMDKQAIGNVMADNNGAGVDSDPNAGQVLTVTQVNGVPANLNDTITLPSGARLLVNGDGSYIYDPSSLSTPPTSSAAPFVDTFNYTISDGKGGTSTATVTITVTYINPIVIDNQASTDGALVEFDVSNKFADITATVDVDYSSTNLPAGLSIDPATGIISGTIASGASTGDASNDGSRTYSASVTVTELDANGVPTNVTHTRIFTWVVTNVPPVAVNDSGTTREGQAVSGNVLSNDHDGSPDGDVLSVTDFSFTAGGTLYSYAAGNSVRSIPGFGTISIGTTGGYTFTPDANFHGGSAPLITYTVNDGNNGVATATLNLSVLGVNDITVNEGSPYAVFAVTGVANELVSLSLSAGTANIDANGIPLSDGSEDFGPTIQYSADSGVTWQTYFGTPVALNGSGDLLVRTQIINDNPFEGAQTFTLSATNAGGASDAGVATIIDDGTGTIYNFDGTIDNITSKNDDRTLSVVAGGSFNEASPYATFTVSGISGYALNLALGNTASTSDVDATIGGFTFDYSTDAGASWTTYSWNGSSGNRPSVPASGNVLVRVAIGSEADGVFEGAETFNLTASYATNGAITATGTDIIIDDGTGRIDRNGDGDIADLNEGSGPGAGFDDDRTLSVLAGGSFNEASPYATFTVTGQSGYALNLALGNTASTSDVDATIGGFTFDYSTDAGASWTTYSWNGSSGNRPSVPASGNVLVRVAIGSEADGAFEGAETFNLTASYATNGAITATGTDIIIDDGTGRIDRNGDGDIADLNEGSGPGAGFDDDRTLSVVAGGSFNEASPYATFTVSGISGYALNLALGNTASTSDVDATISGFTFDFSTNGGATWTTYSWNGSSGNRPSVPASGNVLVRVAIGSEADGAFEGAETFNLTASYATNGAITATGTDIIIDDGTGRIDRNGDGDIADPNEGSGPGSGFDDDRGIVVTGGSYNENSPRAIFTIHASPAQLLTLDVRDVADVGRPTGGNEGGHGDSLDNAAIYYSLDGGATWLSYTGAPIVAGAMDVLVAVDITAERDDVYEGEERFQLLVNPGQQTEAAGYASIFDDRTGTVTNPIDNHTTNDTGTDNGTTKDDDRPVPPGPAVPPAPAPLEPPALPVPPVVPGEAISTPLPPFDSTIIPPNIPAVAPVEKPVSGAIQDGVGRDAGNRDARIADIYTSPTGFRVVVIEAPQANLMLYRGVADQYADTGSATSFAVPYDAFAHTDPNEQIILSAKLSDGRPLPKWVRFDSQSGKFAVAPPRDFIGELKIKVIARDSQGHEVSSLFRFTVGDKQAVAGRPGLSEQLRFAGQRGMPKFVTLNAGNDSDRTSPGLAKIA